MTERFLMPDCDGDCGTCNGDCGGTRPNGTGGGCCN